MSVKYYAKYRDSEISWIGAIPKEWNVRRIKNLIIFHQAGAWGEEVCEDDNNRVCIRVADFDFEHLAVNSDEYTIRNYLPSQIEKLTLQIGDILIEKSGGGEKSPVGRIVMFDKDFPALYANFIEAIRPNTTVINRFLGYILASAYHKGVNRKYYNQTTGIQNLNLTLYICEKVCIPSLNEQSAIVTYLDRCTAEIDKLLADLQSQADMLDRYKRELIADVVTHGIDKTVSRKDSGVDWIGKVPTDWMVVPLRAVAKDNTVKNDGMQCDNLLSLSYGKIIRKDIDTNFGLLPESFEGYQVVQAGYTVLRLTDLQNDKRSLRTGYVSEAGIITSAYTGLIPSKQIDGKYFTYLLHAYDLKKIYYGLGGGVRQSLKYSDLKTLPILIPPISDQRAIVAYINDKTTQVDNLIADINKQIEKLKQYRQIVIHDAVTGKIKVKEMQNNGN